MRILYDSKKIEYKKPFGALRCGEDCRINIKIPVHCRTTDVLLCMTNDHTAFVQKFDMHLIGEEDDYQTWNCNFTLSETGLYFYRFFVKTAESDFELYRFGYSDTNIGEGSDWQLTCYPDDFEVSESFCSGVMYQIFPDRFFFEELEDADGKLEPYVVHDSVSQIPEYRPDDKGEVLNCDFFGGNLKGITQKLDYIKSLGTSVIYLNPIFMAYSNHRYDTCDYKRIDPLLGCTDDFVKLCDEVHKRGMKIILDGVFSHTGSNSIYFDKKGIFGGGAYRNPGSDYRSWYNFGESDDQYDSWWGINTLPCVNELDDAYLDYIIRDEDSVIAHWLNLGADGYRLDVADELPDKFISLLRQRVKEIKPDSYVVGEVWEDASDKISYGVRRRYFADGELDSVMNYVFKNAIIAYCRDEISAGEFAEQIMSVAENYPPCAVSSLMNFLSTHDTERVLTRLSEADGTMPKDAQAGYRLSEVDRCKALGRVYIAALIQYTLPGNACIYYGDEIGMEGFGDPFNRGFFEWEKAGCPQSEFFEELGSIKNRCAALRGSCIRFERWDSVLSYVRVCGDSTVTIFINKGDNEEEAPTGRQLIAHNVSVRRGKTYVQKGGFVLVEQ